MEIKDIFEEEFFKDKYILYVARVKLPLCGIG